MKGRRARAGGFTIIELLVTVTLVGILGAIAVPAGELLVQREREQALKETLRDLRAAIDAFKRASAEGRIARAVGESGYPRTLAELTGIPDQKDPNGGELRFLRRVPRNPVYQGPDTAPEKTWGLRSYASTHEQPRPGRDVFDIYPLGDGKGINGIPYKAW